MTVTMKWEQLAEYVRLALIDDQPVGVDALLIPRNQERELVRKMKPDAGVKPRYAAALVLLYPHDDTLWLPLTVRSTLVAHHRGEVSLPGGATDPDDDGPIATALRETDEELGVPPDDIQVWGTLTRLYIPASNFCLNPVVGFLPHPPVLVPCSREIAQVFAVSLPYLLNPDNVVVEEWHLNDAPALVPFWHISGHKVWGATAIVLSELAARLRRTLTTFSEL